MKLLILGQNGQLGRELLRVLKPMHEISKVDYNTFFSQNLEYCLNLVTNLMPEIIINTAAWTNVDSAETNEKEVFNINAYWPENLAIVCRKVGIPYFHISTDYVFSGNTTVPWETYSEKKPLNVYGRSKSEGEDRVMNIYPENSFIFRTAWLYSKHRKNFVKTILKKAKSDNAEIKVVSDQFGQPTYAGDLASQISKVIDLQIQPGIYHATNSGVSSWYQFAEEIFTMTGQQVNRLTPVVSNELIRPAIRPTYSVLSQSCWNNLPIAPLRDWKHALKSCIKEIESQVDSELLSEV